ncbi:MAG TPA: hypothetical protein VMN57_13300 [Anaerolineales bacterium]|nr:hypothetical protein [Anaerolineales bacterium]
MMTPPSDYFPGKWLPPVRVLWALAAGVLFAMYIPGMPLVFEELTETCAGDGCTPMSLTAGEAELLAEYGLGLREYAALSVSLEIMLTTVFTSLAVLLIWQRRPLRMGVITAFFFLFLGPVFFGEGVRAFNRVYPGFQTLELVLTSASVVLFILMLHLFPNGRFYPRWNGFWVLPFCVLVVLEPVLLPAGSQTYSASTFVVVWGMSAAVIGLVMQIYRYRKISSVVQRQQTKWVLFGLLAMFLGILPWMVFVEIAPLEPGPGRLIFNLSIFPQYALVLLMPFSLVVSIQRYRLWDIDLIIRRSLQYALLTGSIALIYFGGIIVIQSVIQALTGQGDSPIATVLTTLLIAALFNPLRTRAQDVIDRRFFRAKYDAEQALNRFAAAARDEVDLQRLAGEILGVVGETMQPQVLNLWISPVEGDGVTIGDSWPRSS